MNPKRKYAIGRDVDWNPIYVGSKVRFQADDGDSPYVEPFSYDEVGTIIREKGKLWFVSDESDLKFTFDRTDLMTYDGRNNFTVIKDCV